MPLTPAQVNAYRQEADKLRKILSRGVSDVTTDGVKVTYDLGACRLRLRDITQILQPHARPRASSVYLGGF